MEKQKNRHKSYKSISGYESALLNAVDPFLVFSFRTIKRITNWKNTRINNVLFSLKKNICVISQD